MSKVLFLKIKYNYLSYARALNITAKKYGRSVDYV